MRCRLVGNKAVTGSGPWREDWNGAWAKGQVTHCEKVTLDGCMPQTGDGKGHGPDSFMK